MNKEEAKKFFDHMIYSPNLHHGKKMEVFETVWKAASESPSESEGSDGWVSVEEKPLTEDMGNGRWICTDAGDSEFIAAVPYRDKKQPGKELWWIRHCVISNGDLCVVTDDDVEPSGWEIDSVTHYRPLPTPPKQST